MRDITMAVEELSLSGSISLGNCSVRTLYRWGRDINKKLAAGNYDWRVQVNKEDKCLEVIDKIYAQEARASERIKRGIGMNAEAEIIKNMKAQIAEILDKQAEKQIDERVKRFKEALAREKGRAIADIMEAIEILVSQTPADNSLNFTIHYKPEIGRASCRERV